MTRTQDAAFAASLGVQYVGCVFAGGPRHRASDEAAAVFNALDPRTGPQRAGVFADARLETIEATARVTGLRVIQLHDAPTPATIAALREAVGREIWAVVRCVGAELPEGIVALWRAADAVLLDAKVAGQLGGTGRTLPWQALAESVRAVRAGTPRGKLVLAGGLTPDNVGHAIAALQPDVVDTSSGIELTPGVKDRARMSAFVEAVAEADRSAGTRSNPIWSGS